MSSDQPDKMRDYEVALMDAIRTIFEILIGKGIIPSQVAAEMLRRQREAYPAEEMPGAAFVMNMLLEDLTNPERAAARKLVGDPPQGSA